MLFCDHILFCYRVAAFAHDLSLLVTADDDNKQAIDVVPNMILLKHFYTAMDFCYEEITNGYGAYEQPVPKMTSRQPYPMSAVCSEEYSKWIILCTICRVAPINPGYENIAYHS